MHHTNRDLCAILFAPHHLTLQNIVDHFGTSREYVIAFYRELRDAGLVEILHGEGDPFADVPPLALPVDVLLARAESIGVDLSKPLPVALAGGSA